MTRTLFPQIGRVIACIGSANFSTAFHKLINSQLAVDATHLYLLPRPSKSPPASDPIVFNETVSSTQGATLFTDSVHLDPTQKSASYCCKITVFRARPSHGFSLSERRRLRDISPFLFSILEKHMNALKMSMPRAEPRQPDSLEDRFHERLRETGLTLSERETQVCLGLLAGHTAMQQAERLTLKVNTVGSYQRRAAVKLGISGRRSLMRWMYGSSEGVSMAN